MDQFSNKEIKSFAKLTTPAKIQTYINSIPFNFEKQGETLYSPLVSIRENKIHCFEGALLGAFLLSRIGFKPYIMYLQATKDDYDHVVAPFKINGYWGALSKTNHSILRYREPIYKTIRELVMSYFHEYFLHNGKKTLRNYSALLNLNEFESDWITTDESLWGIDDELDALKHYSIIPHHHLRKLRSADPLEIEDTKRTEWEDR